MATWPGKNLGSFYTSIFRAWSKKWCVLWILFCHKLLLYSFMYCRYRKCNGNLDRSALTLISTYGFGELLLCGGGVQLLTSIQGIEKYWYRSFWFLATSTEDNPGFIQSLNMLGPGNLWGNYQRVKILFYIQYPSWKCCQNRSLPYCMKDKLIKIVLDWYETSPKHVNFQDSGKKDDNQLIKCKRSR